MIAAIEEINGMENLDEIVISSTDADKMYPSLDIDTVARVSAEEFLSSNLDIDIDASELSLYLAVTHTQQELDGLGLSHVTHRRVHRTGP